jgi:hypothetical protein
MNADDLQETTQKSSSLNDCMTQHSLQRSLNMSNRIAAQKPLLTDRKKNKKLDFARPPTRTGPLSRVMYSDKSTFRCIRAIRARVQRPHGSSDLTATTLLKQSSILIKQSEEMNFSSSKKTLL